MITVCSVYIKSISDQLLIASTSVIKLPTCVCCCDSVVGQRREENEISIRDLWWTLTHTHIRPYELRWSASYLAAGDEETRGRRWRRTNQNGRRLLRSIDETKRRETLTECVLTDRLSKRSKINDDYFFWALGFFLHTSMHHWLGRHCLFKRDRS